MDNFRNNYNNSRNQVSNLRSEAERTERSTESLRSTESALSRQATELRSEEYISSSAARSATSQAESQQSALNRTNLNIEQAEQDIVVTEELNDNMRELLELYSREVNNSRLNPTTLLIERINPEDAARSNLGANTISARCIEDFDNLLATIPNVNIPDAEGKTLLMHAIIHGFRHGVEELLERGANVNIVDNNGATALTYATAFPHMAYTMRIAELTEDDYINHRANGLNNNAPLHNLINSTTGKFFFEELEIMGIDPAQGVIFNSCQINHGNSFTGTMTLYFHNNDANNMSIALGNPREDGYTVNQEKTLSILAYLVTRGADVNVQNAEGLTPFFLACNIHMNYLSSQILENYNPNLDVYDNKGWGYLHFSLKLNKAEILQNLLDRELDINNHNESGITALHLAASNNGLSDIAGWLIREGADLGIQTSQGLSPIHIAALNGNIDILRSFVRSNDAIDVDQPQENNPTPLYLAAQNGHLEIVRYLVEHNADVNAIGVNGMNVLFTAVVHRHPEIVSYLLAHGAAANTQNTQGAYPVHVAAENGDLAMLEVLNGHTEMDREVSEQLPATPLYLAAQNGHLSVVNWLHSHGANINAVGLGNMSPLYIAALKGHDAVVNSLLAANANTDIANANGFYPIHAAINNGHIEVIRALIDAGMVNQQSATGVSPLYYSLGFGGQEINMDIVRLLLDNGADINKQTNDNFTPLYFSVCMEDLSTAEFLLSNGADVMLRAYTGDTPLHRASILGNINMMRLLLGYMEHPNHTNHEGDTPLSLLIKAEISDIDAKVSAIQCLLQSGASVDIANNAGETPLTLAEIHLTDPAYSEQMDWFAHPEMHANEEFGVDVVGDHA